MPLNPSCPICLDDVQSLDHLFLQCSVTRKVGDLVIQHGWLPNGYLLNGTQDLRGQLHSIGSCKIRWILAQKISFLLWCIWKNWNNVVFWNEIFNPLRCLMNAKKNLCWMTYSILYIDGWLPKTNFFHPFHHLQPICEVAPPNQESSKSTSMAPM